MEVISVLIGLYIIIRIIAVVVVNFNTISRIIAVPLFSLVRLLCVIYMLALIRSAWDEIQIQLYIMHLGYDTKKDTILFIAKLILQIDIKWSILSFICAIPLGKPWFTPRLPLPLTIITMLVQSVFRKKKYYCTTCHKNFKYNDIGCKCSYCNSEIPIKMMGIDGRIYHKCPDRDCDMTTVLTLIKDNDSARTRFYKFNPFIENGRRTMHCKYCDNIFENNDKAASFSLYCAKEEVAKTFRSVFFYNSFGPGRKANRMSIQTTESPLLKRSDYYYENDGHVNGFKAVSAKPIILQLKTESKSVNKSHFYFNIAVANSEHNKLVSSEGIILLLEGAADNYVRQTQVDQFLVDLESVKSSKLWENTVLVGICANGVDSLETAIENGFSSAYEMEQKCRSFLTEQNNEEIISRLGLNINNLHFFIYRTGSAGEQTEDKIYNVLQPVQALIYDVHKEMKSIWPLESNGFCPEVHGKSI